MGSNKTMIHMKRSNEVIKDCWPNDKIKDCWPNDKIKKNFNHKDSITKCIIDDITASLTPLTVVMDRFDSHSSTELDDDSWMCFSMAIWQCVTANRKAYSSHLCISGPTHVGKSWTLLNMPWCSWLNLDLWDRPLSILWWAQSGAALWLLFQLFQKKK